MHESIHPGSRPPSTLVLLRHGESVMNAGGCFTGRLDVGLTAVGFSQAVEAAELIAHHGITVDRVVTSPMLRARETAEIVVARLGVRAEPITEDALVERDYGRLTGMAKSRAMALLGSRDYMIVRRTLDGRPPAAAAGQLSDRTCYASAALPEAGTGEPLSAVVDRVGRWWSRAGDQLEPGSTVLVVAHGNSLRALCAVLDLLTPVEVENLNIPSCQPLVYRLAPGELPTPRGGRYLDLWNARHAAAAIAREGGT